MNIHPIPFDTGKQRLDIGLTALRNSGGAWWLVLGMILLQEATVYMNSTELGGCSRIVVLFKIEKFQQNKHSHMSDIGVFATCEHYCFEITKS